MSEPMRLQRYLAAAGVAARRKAEDLIVAGRVTVNGKVVTVLGTKIDPASDQVTVDGEAVVALDHFYVLFNKPKGCITAVTDDRGRPTVMDYLPNLPVPVKPVGRLDFYSEGVLLLTNDGELAARLLAPGSHVPKTYHVKVHGQLGPNLVAQLREGVTLDDGTQTLPAEVEVLPGESKHTWLGITIHEGKHRQIHRMIEALGFYVDKLQRVAFANLTFHGLRVGDARELTQQELNELRDAVGLDHSAVARGKWRVEREGTDIPRRARAKAREEAEAAAATREDTEEPRDDLDDWSEGAAERGPEPHAAFEGAAGVRPRGTLESEERIERPSRGGQGRTFGKNAGGYRSNAVGRGVRARDEGRGKGAGRGGAQREGGRSSAERGGGAGGRAGFGRADRGETRGGFGGGGRDDARGAGGRGGFGRADRGETRGGFGGGGRDDARGAGGRGGFGRVDRGDGGGGREERGSGGGRGGFGRDRGDGGGRADARGAGGRGGFGRADRGETRGGREDRGGGGRGGFGRGDRGETRTGGSRGGFGGGGRGDARGAGGRGGFGRDRGDGGRGDVRGAGGRGGFGRADRGGREDRGGGRGEARGRGRDDRGAADRGAARGRGADRGASRGPRFESRDDDRSNDFDVSDVRPDARAPRGSSFGARNDRPSDRPSRPNRGRGAPKRGGRR